MKLDKHTMAYPSANTRRSKAVAVTVAMAALVLAGCGSAGTSSVPSAAAPISSPSANTQIRGHVAGGLTAITNAGIQLYAVGTQGTGSTATPLLTTPVVTDASGNFTITETYTCPSPASQLYVVAAGGNPALAAGTNNQALALMTVLGACNTVSSTTVYPINEVTTVGSVWPLSSYMMSATQLGSASSDATFAQAITLINQLVNLGKAVSPGTGVPAGYAVQTEKLYTLADVLDACVSSAGGTAGDGSACGRLFSFATPPGGTAPTTIIDAALHLAQNSQLNVSAIYQALPAESPFQPALPIAPPDLSLGLVAVPAAPTITPTAGAYAVGQQIALSSATTGAVIHYTLDGSAPALTSPAYGGPFALSSSETVNAIAVTEDIASAVSSAAFSVNTTGSVTLSPASVSLSSAQTQQFTPVVTGSANTAVTWALSPAVGSISAGGLYTAPALISSGQTITVSATSIADPTKSGTAVITLNLIPAIAVSVAPASVSLAPSQTQQFTPAVTGTPNAAITWTLSPAVGTISSNGLYTAPPSIVGLQNITVTATSTTDPTKTATASIAITPQGPGYVTYYVDNAGGSDNNVGTSPSAAFATIAKVNSLTLQPGQTVAFKAGDTWHEMLTVTHSGSSGLPINYTSYGAGAQPVIDASDTVTGWSLRGTSGTLPSYIWTHVQPTDPLLINFSGVAGIPVAASANITAPDQFSWDGSTLYVYSNADPTSTVEIASRPSALTSPGASYLLVSNLEFRGGTDIVYCGVANPCANWDFESNTIDSGYEAGLHWKMNQAVSGAALTINHNTFRGMGGPGISVANGGPAMGDMISNNTMTDLCKIYNTQNQYCDAIKLFSQTGTDGGGQVLNNTISEVGLTAGAAFGGGIHPDTVINWDVERNTITDTNYPGIELEKGSGSVARYNLLVNAGQLQYFAGLLIRAGEGVSVSNMLAEYNTVVGGYLACSLGISQGSGAVTATNITIARNICTGSASGIQFWLDSGYADASNSFTTNGFGVASPNFVKAGNVAYGTYPLLPSPIVNSISGDPQFVNQGAGDYHLQSSSPDVGIGAFPAQ